MKKLNESLKPLDLENLIKEVFEVDAYKSKISDDEDVVVLSFTVQSEEPAKDLEHFIEMGYDFVLDADVTPGETDEGTYKVFVEIERSKHVSKHIVEILKGISRLTGIHTMKFRYFKNFKSFDATLDNLEEHIPASADEYLAQVEKHEQDNFTNFFSNSYVESVDLVNESLIVKPTWGREIKFKVVDSDFRDTIHTKYSGAAILESTAMAEVIFLTKAIGNYHITKVGRNFIFENKNWAIVVERE